MINLKSIKKVLFLFCHPDDETLGSGGTMSRFSREKKNVYLAFSSLGIDSRHKNNNKALRIQKKRIKEDLDKVLRLYKIKKKNLFSNNFPDNKSDTVPLLEIIKWCENLISKINQISYLLITKDVQTLITVNSMKLLLLPQERNQKKRLLSFLQKFYQVQVI